MATIINLGRVKGSMWYTGTMDSSEDISNEITSAGYTPIELDMYLNGSNGNVYQYLSSEGILTWTLKGNIKGATGEGGGSTLFAGENIKIENNVISVLTTNDAQEDNTRPITSAGVNTIVGNIEVLLKTI